MPVSELTLGTLIAAALIDSINPCEFAVLLLLMSTILASGNRTKALWAGLAFSSAIFLSYIALGLSLFSVIQFSGFSTSVFRIVAILAIVVGIFNVKDYFKLGAFGFEMAVPHAWRPRMKSIIRHTTTVPGAFVTGFIVSLFLTPCTSGPYLVVLSMLADQTTFWGAVPLLLLYNLVFIAPMVILVFLVWRGFADPKKAERWRKKRVKQMHLVAGILMIALGLWLLVTYF